MSIELDKIFNDIKSGRYDKSPVGVGNLTLKIGQIVDQEIKTHFKDSDKTKTVLLALEMLRALYADCANTSYDVFGVQDALDHKFEYLINAYLEYIPEEIWNIYNDFLNHAKYLTVNTLKGVPGNTMVRVLQRVVNIDENGDVTGHYEIVEMPVANIISAKGIPAKQGFMPVSVRSGGGGNPPPPNNVYLQSPPAPPSPPSPVARQVPPVPPHFNTQTPPMPPKDSSLSSRDTDVDILTFIFIALLNAVTQSTTAVANGVNMVIKPEVLRQQFDKYDFCYDFIKRQFIPSGAIQFVSRDFDYFGVAGRQISGTDYVYQIMDKMGLEPHLNLDNSLVATGEFSSILLNITNFDWLYMVYKSITPDQMTALKALADMKPVSLVNTPHTAFSAYSFWQDIHNRSLNITHNMNNGYYK